MSPNNFVPMVCSDLVTATAATMVGAVPKESSDLVTEDDLRRSAIVPNVLQEIADHFTALAALRAEWQAEIASLEAAGMYEAIPAESWETRNGGGRYLRLVFPTDRKTGQRRKLYVGAYPSAIAEARAKVERRKRWEELTRNLARLAHALSMAERELTATEMGLRLARRELVTNAPTRSPAFDPKNTGHRW